MKRLVPFFIFWTTISTLINHYGMHLPWLYAFLGGIMATSMLLCLGFIFFSLIFLGTISGLGKTMTREEHKEFLLRNGPINNWEMEDYKEYLEEDRQCK